MSTMFYAVCIVAIVFTAGTIHKYLDMKKAQSEADPEVDNLLADMQRLEERIKVLERIVTEDRHDLKSEIDRLQ